MYDFNQKPELNVTPLVDIMLVLLAILMVTAPVMEFEEPVNLPSGSKTKQIENVKKITIFINKNREVTINKNKYDLKDFPDSFILFAKTKNRNTPVHIRADKTLVYDDVIYILKTVKEAGFFKVSLITDG
ncbi:biopolymer transporter ExbD [Arcobacter sp. CECT 8985]|uniref:biopolymer transporter ExbD n=1 Tax=Arcobacter sp. CECT 8985 TaxID=1935424 RepID=UPI00100B5683|nr:biopolymer transporter ExbD [Arcobacter sp. CECT 8985]RXJ86565.1 biopolymer transporter ExbD [Arcobacter sp. CECT 8985]